MKKTQLIIGAVIVLALFSIAAIDRTGIGARFAEAVNQAAVEELYGTPPVGTAGGTFARSGLSRSAPQTDLTSLSPADVSAYRWIAQAKFYHP